MENLYIPFLRFELTEKNTINQFSGMFNKRKNSDFYDIEISFLNLGIGPAVCSNIIMNDKIQINDFISVSVIIPEHIIGTKEKAKTMFTIDKEDFSKIGSQKDIDFRISFEDIN